ncbi:hypothetical protein IX39_16075 [Chryseobacterium formosense]|uniref:Uncharacterized protein n=1 Tax=Chryseobacterium formosense TaxID=236814 RepID=A0A085Z3A8_9FLAO|nr:hypothetical protein [Chryseobacterium formosense]KFE98921.1 hypothetical protein IX39_16075 [Chryseobacterium formosense]SFT59171.1 hypothetical protein SAMN05421857_1909 [Chryseobacterium formosense]
MRRIILCVFTIIFTNFFSQSKRDNDYKKLIDSALILKANDTYRFYNKELEREEKADNWKIYLHNFKKKINNIYIIDENHLPVNLENVKTDIPLKTIDIENPKNRSVIKKGLDAWKIIPILSENELKINIIAFKVTYKHKLLQFSNGGGSTIIFQYSCEEKKWKLIKEKHKGI